VSENSRITVCKNIFKSLKPDYFHIIPSIENTITGTNDDDTEESHIGTSGNDYIQGGSDAIGRFSDGPDILNGKEGDDVLVGGPNKRAVGGWERDTYVFEANSGNDLIIGFLFDGTGYVGEYNDILKIASNINESGLTSYSEIISATVNNADGWAVIDFGNDNTVTLHGVQKTDLLERNFQFFD
jgi:hypothetical protein